MYYVFIITQTNIYVDISIYMYAYHVSISWFSDDDFITKDY